MKVDEKNDIYKSQLSLATPDSGARDHELDPAQNDMTFAIWHLRTKQRERRTQTPHTDTHLAAVFSTTDPARTSLSTILRPRPPVTRF